MTETDNDVDIVELLHNILKARSVAMTIAHEGPHLELYIYTVDGYDYGILNFFRKLQDGNGDALFHARGRIAIASTPNEGEELNEQLTVLQLEAMMIEKQIELLESNQLTIEKIGGGSLFTHMKTTTIMRAMMETSVDEMVGVLADGL